MAQETKPVEEAAKGGERSSVWTHAKWLVPSAPVLLIVFGYVSESAHQGLLGISLGTPGTNDYVILGARFLVDVCMELVGFLSGNFGLLLFSEDSISFGWVFYIVLVAAILAFLYGFYVRKSPVLEARFGWRPAEHIPLFLPLLLVGLVFGKLFYVDLPLTRVSDVLVHKQDTQAYADIMEVLLGPKDKGVTLIRNHAEKLLHSLFCSKHENYSRVAKPKGSSILACSAPKGWAVREFHQAVLHDVFIWFLFITAAILVTSALLLRRVPIASVNVLVLTVSAYAILLLPYAHGKLLRSTEYPWGMIVFKSAVAETPRETPVQQPGTITAPTDSRAGTLHERAGFFLAGGGNTAKLLIQTQITCRKPDGKPGTVSSETGEAHTSGPTLYQDQWRFWQANIGDIVVIRQIEQREIIDQYLGARDDLKCIPDKAKPGSYIPAR